MKYLLLFTLVSMFLCGANAQLIPGTQLAKTTSLPEGTAVKDGRVSVLPGYRAFYSDKDKGVVLVQKSTNLRMGSTNVITGSFSCFCNKSGQTNDCQTAMSGSSISCTGEKCSDCKLSIAVKPKAGVAITRQTAGETWKEYVFPDSKQ